MKLCHLPLNLHCGRIIPRHEENWISFDFGYRYHGTGEWLSTERVSSQSVFSLLEGCGKETGSHATGCGTLCHLLPSAE
jgi:hypothetical protein